MGRHSIPDENRKALIGASIEKRMIEKIGLLNCKRIAEEAVIKHFKRVSK